MKTITCWISVLLFFANSCKANENGVLYIEFDKLVYTSIVSNKTFRIEIGGKVFNYAIYNNVLIVATLPDDESSEADRLFYSLIRWHGDSLLTEFHPIKGTEHLIDIRVSPKQDEALLVSIDDTGYIYHRIDLPVLQIQKIPELQGSSFVDWLSSHELVCEKEKRYFSFDLSTKKQKSIDQLGFIQGKIFSVKPASDSCFDLFVVNDSIEIYRTIGSRVSKKASIGDVFLSVVSEDKNSNIVLLTKNKSDEFILITIVDTDNIQSTNVSEKIGESRYLHNVILSSNSIDGDYILYSWSFNKGNVFYRWNFRSNRFVELAHANSNSRDLKKIYILSR